MKIEEKFPTDEIRLKEEYAPYTKYEEILSGYKLTIDVPNKYDIKLKTYHLVPGISIILDTANLIDQYSNKDDVYEYDNPDKNLLINYIVKGQCQLKVGSDKYLFVKDKDINLYIKDYNKLTYNYTGETQVLHIILNRDQFKESISDHNKEYLNMIEKIFEIAKKEEYVLFKSNDKINSIVDEIINFKPINSISDKIHLQLKTLEILLNLYQSEIKDEKIEQRTYTDAQIRVVRNIKNTLSRDISSYISLEVLSASYGINLTTLKNCFKDMYGKPLYSWYREYKFYRAQELIKNTDYPISKIAYMIGYKSSSKFSKAFKQETGVLPSTYRKNNR